MMPSLAVRPSLVIENLRGRYHTLSSYGTYPTSHHNELPLYQRRVNNSDDGERRKIKGFT